MLQSLKCIEGVVDFGQPFTNQLKGLIETLFKICRQLFVHGFSHLFKLLFIILADGFKLTRVVFLDRQKIFGVFCLQVVKFSCDVLHKQVDTSCHILCGRGLSVHCPCQHAVFNFDGGGHILFDVFRQFFGVSTLATCVFLCFKENQNPHRYADDGKHYGHYNAYDEILFCCHFPLLFATYCKAFSLVRSAGFIMHSRHSSYSIIPLSLSSTPISMRSRPVTGKSLTERGAFSSIS